MYHLGDETIMERHAKVENGGKPTPDKVTSGAYEAEPEEVILYKIDAKEADPLLAELSGIIKKMSDKVLQSDMVYFKKVVGLYGLEKH